MNIGRQVFEFLKAGAMAHARWEIEVSMSILRNRKKLLILLSMLLPILAVAVVEGADILGGKTAYAPAHYTTTIFLVSIAIGLCAGLITGCIGAGGGFIITPALMAAGVKGILAVGTDLFHIFAKAIMGTAVHKKLGNVSVKLAVAFLVGSAVGTFIGGFINKALYNIDPLLSDTFISVIYAVLLGFLGFYALFDYLKSSKGDSAASSGLGDCEVLALVGNESPDSEGVEQVQQFLLVIGLKIRELEKERLALGVGGLVGCREVKLTCRTLGFNGHLHGFQQTFFIHVFPPEVIAGRDTARTAT